VSELTYTGRDGIPIEPLYTEPVDIDVPAREGPWQVRAVVHTPKEAEEAIALGADSLWWFGGEAPGGWPVPVVDDATPVASTLTSHLDGATEVEELAVLHRHGQLPDTGLNEVRTAMGRDVFKGIAKLRAIRILWRDVRGRDPFIHAVGSHRSLTRYDAHTNILRQTTQAFAAALGGADAISLWPFHGAAARQRRLARRLAITTQLVLREEAMLASIADPAKGSYYLDWLTREFVERARRPVQPGPEVYEPILGVTEYPLADDAPLPGKSAQKDASEWEAMRDEPAGRIYLCKLGSPREHGEESSFARSLFVTGGFEVVEGEGPEGFFSSGADIACVVGPGDVRIEGARRVIRNLDPNMDKLAFLKELRG